MKTILEYLQKKHIEISDDPVEQLSFQIVKFLKENSSITKSDFNLQTFETFSYYKSNAINTDFDKVKSFIDNVNRDEFIIKTSFHGQVPTIISKKYYYGQNRITVNFWGTDDKKLLNYIIVSPKLFNMIKDKL